MEHCGEGAQLKEKRPGYGALLDFYVAVRESQVASRIPYGWIP